MGCGVLRVEGGGVFGLVFLANWSQLYVHGFFLKCLQA